MTRGARRAPPRAQRLTQLLQQARLLLALLGLKVLQVPQRRLQVPHARVELVELPRRGPGHRPLEGRLHAAVAGLVEAHLACGGGSPRAAIRLPARGQRCPAPPPRYRACMSARRGDGAERRAGRSRAPKTFVAAAGQCRAAHLAARPRSHRGPISTGSLCGRSATHLRTERYHWARRDGGEVINNPFCRPRLAIWLQLRRRCQARAESRRGDCNIDMDRELPIAAQTRGVDPAPCSCCKYHAATRPADTTRQHAVALAPRVCPAARRPEHRDRGTPRLPGCGRVDRGAERAEVIPSQSTDPVPHVPQAAAFTSQRATTRTS
jgi:hypothetical protein